jgi:hypothetical protein
MFQKMRQQADMTAGVCGAGRFKATDIIKDIVDKLPDKAYLNRISIALPLNKASSPSLLDLVGHAVAEDTGRETDMALQFGEELRKTPVLGKAFPNLQVDVKSEPSGMEKGGSLTPEAFMEKQETRTTFTISGGAKMR